MDNCFSVENAARATIENAAIFLGAFRRTNAVIDPRSGEPMTHAYQAAIVAPTAGEAEAWSKALLVLGADEGLALLAEHPGVEGLLVDEAGRRFATPGFVAAAGFEAL